MYANVREGNETDLIEGLIAPAQQHSFCVLSTQFLTEYNEDRVTMVLKTNNTHTHIRIVFFLSVPIIRGVTDCFRLKEEQQVTIRTL